jgi:hypothetical protein
MNIRPSTPLPVALRSARRQFDRWRSRQPQRTRLPEDLWQKAVILARAHGINKTAGALGLKYESLKKHLEAASSETSDPKKARAAFVELLPREIPPSSLQCMIEVEDGHGATIRMHVQGIHVPDLVAFAHLFQGGRA